MIQGLPQEPILGPILFNIYINDHFFFLTPNICNFADDTVIYMFKSGLKVILQKLEEHYAFAMKWFEIYKTIMNADKCHLNISGNKCEQMWVGIRDDMIWKNIIFKLLGITINNKLRFDEHTTNTCIKANRKFTVLTRMRKHLDFV